MQYSNFIMKNNVHASLSTAVSSVATTIQLVTGQGARFGTEFPQIATLESFDENGKVIKREIVQITARNDDDLTVVRAFAPCPANDDANSQSQSSVSFSADDQISLYIPKEIFDKISQSMNDIYDNGTNNMRTDLVSGLQVEVNPGSVLVGSSYYDFAGGTITLTDNATNYLEIDEDGNLANNTTGRNDENTKLAIITTANGSVTNIQDWRLGTIGGKLSVVNIHDLTEKEILDPDDEFIVSDSEAIRQNKKIKARNVFGYEKGICVENMNLGDIVSLKDYGLQTQNGLSSIDLGKNISSQKLSVKIYGNGNTSNFIYANIGKSGNGQNLIVRIETDNNGEPSGNLIDANAISTINSTDLQNTLTNTKIEFNGDITTETETVYWIVFETENIDGSNYCLIGASGSLYSQSKIYNGQWNNIVLGDGTQITSNGSISGTGGGSYMRTFDYTITLKYNIFLTSLQVTGPASEYAISLTIYENGNQIFFEDGHSSGSQIFNINMVLKEGNNYQFEYFRSGTAPTVGTVTGFSGMDFVDTISGTHGPRTSTNNKFIREKVNEYSLSVNSSIAMNMIKKVDTTKIQTFDDIVGIILGNGSEGDIKYIAINNGIITNNDWDLKPGQDYFFINNSISDTPTANTNVVYIGKAINKIAIKVNIKKAIYNLSSDIAPFTGLNSGNPIYKGETVSGTLTAGY